MKDAIDKRNEREKIAKSIVKRRNIVYISKEELERREQEEKRQENREVAEEMVKRLKEEEDNKQAMQIQRLLAEQQMLERQLETGMDATGKHPMNDVIQERVEAILSEKSRQLKEIIDAHSVDNNIKNQALDLEVSKNNETHGSQSEEGIAQTDTAVAASGIQSDLPDMEVLLPEDEGDISYE